MSFSIIFVVCLTSFHSYTWATRLLADSERGSETTKVQDTAIDPYTSLTCNFDNSSFCGWKNVNPDFQWELGIGKDSWRRKGRTGVKSGEYIYINSDRGENRTAFLASMAFNQTEPACMTFQYHMKGRHIGHLKIYDVLLMQSETIPGEYINMPIAQHLRWGVSGQQSPYWQYGQVQMPALNGGHLRQVLIQAFDWEQGRAGNIVVDDIKYNKVTSLCTLMPSWAAPPPTPTTHPQTTTTKVTETTEEVKEQITATEIAKVPRIMTAPVLNVFTTTTKIDDTTTQFTLPGKMTTTNTSTNIQTSMDTPTFATQDSHTDEKTARSATGVPYELSTSLTSAVSVQMTQGRQTRQTTRGESTSSINPITKMDQATLKTGGGVTSSNRPAKLHIGVIVSAAVIGFVLIVIITVCCYRRIQRIRKFEYYDNHTVRMARIAEEDEKKPDVDTVYEKLT